MRTDADLRRFMTELGAERPIFHSEADLQHAFAMLAARWFPRARIRLEVPYRALAGGRWETVARESLDVLVDDGAGPVFVELKYLRASWDAPVLGELVRLAPAARDLESSSFVKDVARLERLTAAVPGSTGLALMVSNDAAMWRPRAGSRATNWDAFRLHEGTVLSGTHAWGEGTAASTTNLAGTHWDLIGRYECRWVDYAVVAEASPKNGVLRYLPVWVHPRG